MIPELVWRPDPGTSGRDAESSGNSALELRMGFFREQWEVAGPGWLHLVGLKINQSSPARPNHWSGPADSQRPSFAPELANPSPIIVCCRAPISGAGAGVIDRYSCWCTALLHDLDPRVPETWRLTWALAAVLLLRDQESDGTPNDNRNLLRQAAALTLETGRELGMVPADDPSLDRLAQEMWCPDQSGAIPAKTADPTTGDETRAGRP